MTHQRRTHVLRRVFATVVGMACCAVAAPACGGSGSNNGITTITLEGPNQWNSSGASFGPAWDKLIAAFQKKEPKIKVNTVVLPLKTFNQTLSTQLSAGTAKDLVFNQATYKPYMVSPLDKELKQPDPYVPGNKKWLDLFDAKRFSPEVAGVTDPEGHMDWIPFNLVAVGVFYNKQAFAKAHVRAPITTFSDLMNSCQKLKTAGYTPFAMEDSDIGVDWSARVIFNMMMAKYYHQLDAYDALNKPGSNPQITSKDWAKAVLSGQITTRTPEVVESLKLPKQFFDNCATKDWSGITGNSGALVNIRDFSAQKAAMTWGTDYAPSALGGVKFDYSTMPFPTITKSSSDLSTNFPAQWGAGVGGTSYMIPSTVKGDHRAAAVKFLQFVSAPKYIQPWLDATGAIPAVTGAHVPASSKGFTAGHWSEPMKVGQTWPGGPPGTTAVSLYDGYLLGSKSLDDELSYLQSMWDKSQKQAVEDNNWTNEPWAK